MQNRQSALDALVALPVTISVGNVPLDVTPLTMSQLPRILRLAQPFLVLLETVRSAEDVLALMADHGEAITEITAIAADVPLETLKRVSVDHVAELFMGVLEVNADFFAARLPALMARLQAGMAKVGGAVPSGPNGSTPSAA